MLVAERLAAGGQPVAPKRFWRGFVALRQVKFALPPPRVRAEEKRREGHRQLAEERGVFGGMFSQDDLKSRCTFVVAVI